MILFCWNQTPKSSKSVKKGKIKYDVFLTVIAFGQSFMELHFRFQLWYGYGINGKLGMIVSNERIAKRACLLSYLGQPIRKGGAGYFGRCKYFFKKKFQIMHYYAFWIFKIPCVLSIFHCQGIKNPWFIFFLKSIESLGDWKDKYPL